MTFTVDQLNELNAVNDKWNAIPFNAVPSPDEPLALWKDKPDGGSWVCRDYTFAKADELRTAGWNPLNLTVVELWTEIDPADGQREYHAVLCVDGGNSDLRILDNRARFLYPPTACPFDYMGYQRQLPGSIEWQLLPAGWFKLAATV